MTTRSVTDTLRHADGTPWINATVRFELLKGSYTGSAAYPPDSVTATTNASGVYTVTLWCDEEGARATRYLITYPNGDTFKIDLPVGDGSLVAMSALRTAPPAVPAANLQTLLESDAFAALVQAVIRDYLAAGDNVTITPSGNQLIIASSGGGSSTVLIAAGSYIGIGRILTYAEDIT